MATADKPLILAMTASPGGAQVKVQEVCTNLGITQVENRTEKRSRMSGPMSTSGRSI